jgi:hypothetical protein
MPYCPAEPLLVLACHDPRQVASSVWRLPMPPALDVEYGVDSPFSAAAFGVMAVFVELEPRLKPCKRCGFQRMVVLHLAGR